MCNLSIFSFVACAFGVVSKEALPNQCHENLCLHFLQSSIVLALIFRLNFKIFIYLFLERKRKININVRKKYQSVASCMCPDQRSNRQPFTLRDDAPATEPHQSELDFHFIFSQFLCTKREVVVSTSLCCMWTFGGPRVLH